MKYEDFTKDMQTEIANEIQNCLKKLGIHTSVGIFPKEKSNGEIRVNVKSDTFNTSPVMFKKVFIDGYGTVEKDEEYDGTYNLTIALDYRWETFSGGYNGTELATVTFRMCDNDDYVRFMGFAL